jgi:hypothetical protein
MAQPVARSAVNRKVGGSSPPGSGLIFAVAGSGSQVIIPATIKHVGSFCLSILFMVMNYLLLVPFYTVIKVVEDSPFNQVDSTIRHIPPLQHAIIPAFRISLPRTDVLGLEFPALLSLIFSPTINATFTKNPSVTPSYEFKKQTCSTGNTIYNSAHTNAGSLIRGITDNLFNHLNPINIPLKNHFVSFFFLSQKK